MLAHFPDPERRELFKRSYRDSICEHGRIVSMTRNHICLLRRHSKWVFAFRREYFRRILRNILAWIEDSPGQSLSECCSRNRTSTESLLPQPRNVNPHCWAQTRVINLTIDLLVGNCLPYSGVNLAEGKPGGMTLGIADRNQEHSVYTVSNSLTISPLPRYMASAQTSFRRKSKGN